MNAAFAQSEKAPYTSHHYVAPSELGEKTTTSPSPPIHPQSPVHIQGPQPQPVAQSTPQLYHHQAQVHQMQQPQPVLQMYQQPQASYVQPVQMMQPMQPGQQTHPVVNLHMQQQPQPYLNATPIRCLGMSSSVVDCPVCGQRAMTNVTYITGNTTHIWAGVLCFFTCFFCWVPYMMNGLKDVQHRCSTCGTLLATWHKSGSTETHTTGA